MDLGEVQEVVEVDLTEKDAPQPYEPSEAPQEQPEEAPAEVA